MSWVGLASNRLGIGAKVRARATIHGKTMWQVREITQGGSRWYRPLVGHFRLGDATNVDELRIEWPSGVVQSLTNVAPRQILTVVEHQSLVSTNAPVLSSRISSGSLSVTASGDPGLVYVLEAGGRAASAQISGGVGQPGRDATVQRDNH